MGDTKDSAALLLWSGVKVAAIWAAALHAFTNKDTLIQNILDDPRVNELKSCPRDATYHFWSCVSTALVGVGVKQSSRLTRPIYALVNKTLNAQVLIKKFA